MRCDGMASPFFPPSFLLQMQTAHPDGGLNSAASVSPLLPAAACAKAQDFHGDGAELSGLLGKRSASLSGLPEACEDVANYGEEDLLQLSDDCSGAAGGEKKRRLNVEQVRTLELNFEMGNKLEPERKMQLARALRLQPRQVAIWFQNRRARWKTKQMERDYEELRRRADALGEENDALRAQNKALEGEINALRERRRRRREATEPINLNKETEGSCSNRSDNSSDINPDVSRSTPAAAQGRPLFRPVRSPAAAEVLPHHLHRPRDDEGFCNMFPGLDDQAGFCWGWSEQHSFL